MVMFARVLMDVSDICPIFGKGRIRNARDLVLLI